MRAREAVLSSDAFGDDLADCLPLIDEGVSDSAAFDRALELMVLGGRTPPHAMMMMIPAVLGGPRRRPRRARGLLPLPLPPARAVGRPGRDRLLRRPHARRDARPQRPAPRPLDDHPRRLGLPRLGVGHLHDRLRTRSPGWAACTRRSSSSSTSTPVSSAPTARSSWRWPAAAPYGEWYAEGKLGVRQLPDPMATIQPVEPLLKRQLAFGYTQEDLTDRCSRRSSRDGREPTGSMGNDLSLAVFSDYRPSLFSYFKQRFAQVTNPAIDSVREQIVMSLRTDIGPQGNLLSDKPQVVNHVELRPADPHRLRARAAAPQPARRAAQHDDRHHLVDRGRRGRPRGRARADPRPGGRRAGGGHDPARPQRPRDERRAGADPVAAAPARPSTTPSSSRGRDCAPRSSSSPASRARSTTSRR